MCGRTSCSITIASKLNSVILESLQSDTRWVQQTATLQDNPLEHNLGFFDFGKYHKAANDAKYAFEKVGELMGFEIDSDGEDSDDENDDSRGNGNNDPLIPSDNAAQPASSLPQASIIVETGKKTDTSRPLTLAERRRNLVRDVQASVGLIIKH